MLLQLGLDAMLWISFVAAVTALAGAVAAFAHKWTPAKHLSRASVFMAVALVPFGALVLIYGFGLVANAASSSGATLLGQVIACGMNCFFPALFAFVTGGLVWRMARKRLRTAQPMA